MGFIGMIKMVACLVAQRRGNIRQPDIQWNPEERSLPIEMTSINNNHMQQNDARAWHEDARWYANVAIIY